MNRIHISLLAAGFSLVGAASAFAHASFENDKAVSERGFKAILQIPHGCDGKPTNEVQVKLPEGFVFAKPQPKAGWTLEIIKGDYQKTYDDHGKPVKSGPLEIRWKGGELPDEYYDTFVISGRISGFDKETEIAFPVIQLCGTDGKVTWDQIPAAGQSAHDLKSPAPTVTVIPASAADEHAGHGSAAGAADEVKVGSLELSAGSVKAMVPGAKVGGGGLVIHNGGAEDDRLVSAESPAAGRVELHEMSMENDVMKMRKIEDGIVLPAGETVEVDGKLHLMFLDVAKPFAKGDSVKVTLTFEKAGKVDYTLPVGGIAGGHQHDN
ncbi:uncharacterized protein YcnI/copper(I)-binding protein [Pararhizobium capsulatum DSM 1112]|uniref:Uncharacterized protein YcnI/copper(I)-binding protein n=1 Tax=Pararhizobium capsulatum DSM 1112 TaxID=1121113 RepID=A0ABU0BR53_9HYPH|nr:DUF1775 domain-containing protein [Pararhizobium capsulatum]MDQ0320432.1 uncharacterized protein YcnI/copper(I)-binding protein [Pararhizobium capsulatum DSM 1112]